AYRLRAAEVHRHQYLHAPRTKRAGYPRDVADRLRAEYAQIGVDVVYGDTIDSDRRQQSSILADTRKIGACAAVLPEDRPAAIPALDRAVEIVPLVDPAYACGWGLLLIEPRNRLTERHLVKDSENPVEHAAVVRASNECVVNARADIGPQ